MQIWGIPATSLGIEQLFSSTHPPSSLTSRGPAFFPAWGIPNPDAGYQDRLHAAKPDRIDDQPGHYQVQVDPVLRLDQPS